jgi:hypothetical protein
MIGRRFRLRSHWSGFTLRFETEIGSHKAIEIVHGGGG